MPGADRSTTCPHCDRNQKHEDDFWCAACRERLTRTIRLLMREAPCTAITKEGVA